MELHTTRHVHTLCGPRAPEAWKQESKSDNKTTIHKHKLPSLVSFLHRHYSRATHRIHYSRR